MQKVKIIIDLLDKVPEDSAYKHPKPSIADKIEHAFDMLDNSNRPEQAISFLRKAYRCLEKKGNTKLADQIKQKLIDKGLNI